MKSRNKPLILGMMLVLLLLPVFVTAQTPSITPAAAKVTPDANVIRNTGGIPALTLRGVPTDMPVSGSINLSIAESIPPTEYVEFLLNGYPISQHMASGEYTFNSLLQWNQPAATFQAVLHDSAGAIMASSAVIPASIANPHNGTDGAALFDPPLLPGPISGTLTLRAKIIPPVVGQAIDSYIIAVDGKLDTGISGGARNKYLTTHYMNGSHLISNAGVPHSKPSTFFSTTQNLTTMANPIGNMRLIPKYSRLLTTVGVPVPMPVVWQDNTGMIGSTPATVTGISSNPAVATWNGNAVTAVSNGITDITLTSGEFNTAFRVYVDAAGTNPHFKLHGKPIILRSLFASGRSKPAELLAASINTIEGGVAITPASGGGGWRTTTEAASMAYTVSRYQSAFKPFTDAGLGLYMTGDDFMRGLGPIGQGSPGQEFMANCPWAIGNTPGHYVYDVFAYVANTGDLIGCTMVDEGVSLPTSSGGAAPLPTFSTPIVALPWHNYSYSWQPGIFHRFYDAARTAAPGLPLAWPQIGTAPLSAIAAWNDPRIASFADTYWASLTGGGGIQPGGVNPWPNDLMWIGYRLDQVEVGFKRHAPTAFETYVAWSGASGYRDPRSVTTQIWYAIGVRNQGGVRGFQFQKGMWQTEAGQAVSSVFKLIALLEPHLLQPEVSAICLGDSVQTGARRGSSSGVLIALNTGLFPRTISPNLSDYVKGGTVIRYHSCGAALKTVNLGAVTADNVTLQGGECVVYVCLPTTTTTPTLTIQWPVDRLVLSSATPLAFTTNGTGTMALNGKEVTSPIPLTNLSKGTWNNLRLMKDNSIAASSFMTQ